MAKGERTRKEIIDHAFTLAREAGLEAVSLGVLASLAGMSKSGLFAHFKSKEALQLAVVDEAIARFTATVLRPALAEPRGERRVRALFERYLVWKSGNQGDRCLFLSLAHEYDDRPGPIRDRLVGVLSDWNDTIARVARTAIDVGDFRADLDTELFAFECQGIIMAHLHAVSLLALPTAGHLHIAAFEALLDRSRAASPAQSLSR